MCDHCTLLRSHKLRHGPILANHSVCGACALPSDSISTPQPCPACIVYALLHQNTFLKRWNDITTTAPPASPLQAHRSVYHPTSAPSTMSIHSRRPPAMNTPVPRHVSQPLIDLTLTVHTIAAIEAVLPVDKLTRTTAHIHIAHPIMPLNLGHLSNLRAWLNPSTNRPISHRIIYHHLLINANSPLVPRDRSLSLTIDRNIYSLTPTVDTTPTLRPHQLHLFLNPYKQESGGKHTNSAVSTQHLTITTSLPSSLIPSKRPKRHHIMHTTPHTPNVGTVLTFPADSVQHQMTILALATQMLLSIPVIHTPYMVWKIIRQPHTHLHTLHLILATIALKRYHPIWFTEEATPPNTTPGASSATIHSLASVVPASRTQPTPPPAPSPTRTGTTTQLLLLSLLSPNPSKKRPLPIGTVATHPLRPRSSKRYIHT